MILKWTKTDVAYSKVKTVYKFLKVQVKKKEYTSMIDRALEILLPHQNQMNHKKIIL